MFYDFSVPLGGVVLVSKCMGTDTARLYGGFTLLLTERMLSVLAKANRARFNFLRKCSLSRSLLVKSAGDKKTSC